jgi:hypothetical protein
MGTADANPERINSVRFAVAPFKKELNCALSAQNFLARPPNPVQSVTVIVPIWPAMVKF